MDPGPQQARRRSETPAHRVGRQGPLFPCSPKRTMMPPWGGVRGVGCEPFRSRAAARRRSRWASCPSGRVRLDARCKRAPRRAPPASASPPSSNRSTGPRVLRKCRWVARRSKPSARPGRPPRAQPPPSPPRALRVVLRDGPPVTQTTAGTGRRLRALTSVSATGDRHADRANSAVRDGHSRAVIEDQPAGHPGGCLPQHLGRDRDADEPVLRLFLQVRGFSGRPLRRWAAELRRRGDFISLVNNERIEVLKGPAGLLYQAASDGRRDHQHGIESCRPHAAARRHQGGRLRLVESLVRRETARSTAPATALFRMTGEFEGSRDYVDVIEHQRYSLIRR